MCFLTIKLKSIPIYKNIDVSIYILVTGGKIVDKETNNGYSTELHTFIYEQCVDNETKTNNSRQIDQVLYFY